MDQRSSSHSRRETQKQKMKIGNAVHFVKKKKSQYTELEMKLNYSYGRAKLVSLPPDNYCCREVKAFLSFTREVGKTLLLTP